MIAAADGTLSLIKRGSGGYGRVIYLKHAGGFTTLYAHLSAFAPKIEQIVSAKERSKKSFSLKIHPRETIHFKAGEVIGWSGTSGTDLCHLHFELRYKNAPLNPLTHGLKLPDSSPPSLIALYADPLDEKARVEGAMRAKSYPLSARPIPATHIATALYPPSSLTGHSVQNDHEPSSAENSESKTSSQVSSQVDSSEKQETRIKIWGNVGLALEVEDRIDGSDRALTPHQIKLFVDERLVHHLSYDETSYADKRSSELDFDLSRRGESKKLVHRLYRYGPRLRALKRGSTQTLKRLKEGEHKARVEAIDAAGNRSIKEFTIEVEKPKKSPCRLKQKRLPKRKALPLWRPDIPGALELSWRPYGLSFNLPKPCDHEIPLEIDLRVNGNRAPGHAFSLSSDGEKSFLDLHFDRLSFEAKSSQGKKSDKSDNTGNKVKTQKKGKSNRELSRDELPHDRSIELLIGLRGLIDPPPHVKAQETETETERGTSPEDRGLKTLYWYSIKLHEVTSKAYFEGEGARVFVGEESPFKPYVTSLATLPQETESPSNEQSPREFSLRYRFAQSWLPMQKANEVLIKKSKKRGQHLGAYLLDGTQRWWVTSSWSNEELGASSTHLADFVITQDNSPPKIGDPQWDLASPIGPRLIIPVSDDLSGLREPKLLWNGSEAIIEVQPSWRRLIYRPLGGFVEGRHRYEVSVKDRGGHSVTRSGELVWPPPKEATHILSPSDGSRAHLEPIPQN